MMRPKIGFKPVFIAMDSRKPGGAKRAQWNGMQKRAPLAGELYISGAFPVAYMAAHNLSTEYFIAVEVNE